VIERHKKFRLVCVAM